MGVDVDVDAIPSRRSIWMSMCMSMLSPQEVEVHADVDGDVYVEALP